MKINVFFYIQSYHTFHIVFTTLPTWIAEHVVYIMNASIFAGLLVFVTTVTILVGVDTPPHTLLMGTESGG